MVERKTAGWAGYYRDIGLRPDIAEKNIVYVTPLLERNLPPIFDFQHLAHLLGRQAWHLASIVNATEHHYREFRIPKRSGGKRTISAPYPSLCECQRWILDKILYRLRIAGNAYGFVPGRSIVDNASQHVGKTYLTKIDLREFFPSIRIGRIIGLFRSLGYNTQVSLYLAKLCCLNDRLPQGAPDGHAGA